MAISQGPNKPNLIEVKLHHVLEQNLRGGFIENTRAAFLNEGMIKMFSKVNLELGKRYLLIGKKLGIRQKEQVWVVEIFEHNLKGHYFKGKLIKKRKGVKDPTL